MNNNFIGTYYHTLEEKGRVSVPKSFRDNLEEGSVVTHGLDGCLFIFPKPSWDSLTKKLTTLPLAQKAARDFLRLLTYNAKVLEFDKLGRTLLPEHLIQKAEISKEVVFAGALTRVEIWSKEKYHDYLDSIENQEESLEESLGELGI